MNFTESDPAYRLKTLLEFFFRLSWKTRDNICGNRKFRVELPKNIDDSPISFHVVAPVHPLQNRIAAALQRQMHMRTQFRISRKPAGRLFIHHIRFQRTQAYAEISFDGADGRHRFFHTGESVLFFPILTVKRGVDPCQYDFFKSCGDQITRFLRHFF